MRHLGAAARQQRWYDHFSMIPTEGLGSIPRPAEIIAATRLGIPPSEIDALYEAAVRDTIAALEACGEMVVTDGEQRKPSFATYALPGGDALAPDGVVLSTIDGQTRRLPQLVRGPFRYRVRADRYVREALRFARVPVKQAVISAAALSFLYPERGVPGYPREEFIADLRRETVAEIRACLEAGAHKVQIDMTEARLSMRMDPSRRLLKQLVTLGNQVLLRLTTEERRRVGVHTCPGSEVTPGEADYADLFSELFQLNVETFYIPLAREKEPRRVLALLREYARDGRRFFIGVTDPFDKRAETPDLVRDRVLMAAEYIPIAQLGTTDDCGFAPFGDDTSLSRELAFRKIAARIEGTRLASAVLGV
jgi:5-methyltetrahydropteroyltriglutamate--homocysteine methyltransferase